MHNNEFIAKRVTRSYQQMINAPASVVFPLICPVREAEWLDGWDYRLVYSESGFAEEGCVFTSSQTEEKDTIWLITKRDEDNKEIEFARITPESRVAKLNISVEEIENENSRVHITYTYTALNESGNKFIEAFTEAKFNESMKFWEDSMNYFLRTGEKLIRRHP
ncbi:MAG: hypothetical protein JSU83_08500 [Deltaproteobacteria bacterium]|nr:MAG: hypothetical protein JSU83_08500 [Deltaproteobacteria bacterium]